MEISDLTDHVVKYAERYQKDMQQSLAFLSWLNETALNLQPSLEWKKSVYRIVYGGYDPLAIAGSLASGGRFNIGGAQVSALFPNFSMRACLYAASNLECARKEAGNPRGASQEYKLKPIRPLFLLDLKKLLKQKINYPELKEIIDSSPLAARWELQKVPKISQILGHYLRQIGGDGLVYPSTKDPKHKILAFFIKDDQEAQKLFVSNLIKQNFLLGTF